MHFDRNMDQRREPIDRSNTVDPSDLTALRDKTGSTVRRRERPISEKRRSPKEAFPLSQPMPRPNYSPRGWPASCCRKSSSWREIAGVRGIHFDCAEQRASFLKDSAGRLMLSAIIGFFIVMSIGILIAHAMDAFRSDSRH
jgi:hypothetical protein